MRTRGAGFEWPQCAVLISVQLADGGYVSDAICSLIAIM